jgi:hypothetical protein
MLRSFVVIGCLMLTGCTMLPRCEREKTLHNPFPQISKIAITPFFNLSHEPTLDGRRVALAYFNELQQVPGFEVVPVGVVEEAMRQYRIPMRGAEDARRLAQILNVDAVVIGAVTDYTPYYPPRMALQVEWYAANPWFQPIPPGYGLPWGTMREKDIPEPLVFDAQMALAKAQLQSQSPPYEKLPVQLPPAGPVSQTPAKTSDAKSPVHSTGEATAATDGKVQLLGHYQPTPNAGDAIPAIPGVIATAPCSCPGGGGCSPTNSPVFRQTRTYNGNDGRFSESLDNYYFFRDDSRAGGSAAYLQRSDDFIRFCCHSHIYEMLGARGGAGEARLLWRWIDVR